MKQLASVCLLIGLFAINGFAQINFQAINQNRIDLEKLKIDKQQLFGFVQETILTRQPGLGAYGRVPFYPCDMKLGEQKIIDYRTPEGKEIKFLSNPSCGQIVIRTVLETSYRYDKNAITSYKNRQCLLSLETIISPMLEYYTIKYEERQLGDCPSCNFKEKERLDSILAIQKKITDNCQNESPKVMNFITDLDTQIVSSYKIKTNQ